MSSKISRCLDLSRVSITMTYDSEAINDESVYIEHSGPLFLTLDDAHKLYATYADFFALCRELGQRPRYVKPEPEATKFNLPQEFVDALKDRYPDDSPSTIP